MSTQKTPAAAPEQGAAAVAEKAPEPKTLEWRDLTLTLPPALSGMRLVATWRRLTRAVQAEDGEATMNYMVDTVDVILGDDEQQADKVWAKIDADGSDAAEAVFDLIDQAAACYGVNPGE